MSNVISCLLPGALADRSTEGLLGAAERLAKDLGTQHVVIVGASNDGLVELCSQHADKVVVVENPEFAEYQPEAVLSILHHACEAAGAGVVLMSQDTYCQETAARLAFRLKGASIGDAQKLSVSDGKVVATRGVYGGKASAHIRVNSDAGVVWIRARAFEPEPARASAGVIERQTIAADASSATKITGQQREGGEGVRLEDAQIIVSGGRGLGGPEPFEDLARLAETMGASCAASRAACDSGWVPAGYQVGQTGKKVAPELYLAIALSGASQHLMGIADAKIVAAINTDAEAPIFRRCDFGIVEDWKNVVAALTERLAAAKV